VAGGERVRESTDVSTALVTGSTGFVGSHLVRRLVTEGWEVHCITRPSSDLSVLGEAADQVVRHVHDGTTERMLQIVEKSTAQVVFHLASLFLASHKPKDVEGLIRSNVLFGTQLVEAVVALGVPYLINTGTSWQHFNNETYNPVCLYAATKQAFEDVLFYYTETTPLRVVTLELHDTYGPGDPRPRLVPLLCNVAQSGEKLAMSPGEQLIDLVYIDDVVDAFLVAAREVEFQYDAKTSYAVSSGKPIRLRDLVRVCETVLGQSLNIVWGGRAYRPREMMRPWDRGIPLPNWSPKIDLLDGIKKVLGD